MGWVLEQELAGSEVAERLMRTHGVVDFLPVAQFAIELFHFQGTGRDLVKLLGVSAVGAFDGAVEFGGAGGSTNRCRPRRWQACSNSAANSLPPSTCRARMGKGMRCSKVSRNSVALWAVARRWAWITSQREITSRAVNCLKTTPGTGRTSKVSTSTKS